MALTIHSSVFASRSARSISQTQGTLAETLRRLSSGIRLGIAADDPGRLGSSVLATAQVRGVQQSIRNLNDGLSLSQTLEGGLAQLETALQRLRELSVQASSETLNAQDRSSLQTEANQIIAHLDAVVEQTRFNGISLLDGSAREVEIFTEPSKSASGGLKLDLVKVSPSEVNRQASYQSQRRGVYLGDLEDGDLKINGIGIRGTEDVDDDLSFSYQSGSAIAKAKAINAYSEVTGVTARALVNRITANRTISAFTLDTQSYFAINGVKISGMEIVDYDADGKLRHAINSVSEETGVVASLDSQGQLHLVAEDGRNIQIHYSDMFTMIAVGLADTSGDETNLKGQVLKSSIYDVDLFGSIQSVTSSYHSYGGGTSVGGEFDPGRDHVDYVAQVIKDGDFGTAEFRIARETGSEIDAAEDYSFLVLDGPYATDHTPGMEFFSASTETENNGVTGSVSSTGTYNEGADRLYTITVTQEGSTDGAIRAVGDISSNIDGVIHTGVTLSGTITLGTALNQTGEFVTLNLSATPRGQSISETTVGQSYDQVFTQDGTAVNGVKVKGVYTADQDLFKEIRVVEAGYTQGIKLARLQIFNSFNGGPAVAQGAAFDIQTGVDIDIGHGLSIEFTPEAREMSHDVGDTINRGGTASSYDTTGRTVTLTSSTLQFVGTLGDGTYSVNITEAGRTGRAQYEVRFEDDDGNPSIQLVPPATLFSGPVTLADGITFNFDASTPEVSATTASVTALAGDHYGAAAAYQTPNFTFGGAYTGDLNDTTVTVEVTQEGRVLESGEVSTGDAAILKYTIAGTVAGATITGSTFAREGTYNFGEGVTFTINAASAKTQLNLGGVDQGTSHTFAAGSVLGYEGEVTVTLDDDTFDRNRDLTLRLSEIGSLVVGDAGGAAPSGKLLAELVDDANVVVTSASFSVTSGVVNTIDTGLDITFDNSGFTALSFGGAGFLDDQTASMALEGGATYNNTLGDKNYILTFKNPASQSIVQLDNGTDAINNASDVNEVILGGGYSGFYGDQTIDVAFEGTQTSATRTVNGGGADAAALTVSGSYSGAGGDQSLTVTFLGDTIDVNPVNFNPDTFEVSVDPTESYNGLSGDKTLTVEFTGQRTESIDPGTFGGALSVTQTAQFNRGDFTLTGNFTGDNQLQLTSDIDGSTHTYNLSNGPNDLTLGTLNLGEVQIRVNANGTDETGEAFSIDFDTNQEVSISDGTITVNNVGFVGNTIDLGSATFSGAGKIFAQGDPGFDLEVKGSQDGSNHIATVTLVGPRAQVDKAGGFSEIVDISGGEIDLNDATFTGAGKMFASGAPNVKLDISQPHLSEDDSFTVDLTTKSTVTLTGAGGSLANVALDGGGTLDLDALSDADKANLIGGGYDHSNQLGLQLNFSNFDAQVDDTFRLTLSKTPTVNITEFGDGSGGTDYAIGADLGVVNFDLDGKLVAGQDPGFDLQFTDAVYGVDDTYQLIFNSAAVTAPNADLIELNARTMQVNDTFSANLIADTLEVGTSYSVDVVAPHLNAGHIYEIEENVGTLKVGEQITAGTLFSRFEPTVYTMQASVTITDGLNLQFDANGPFEVGDEIRFQARGYRGDYSVFGQYTDPAYPTTFEVEVIQTGDVDGGALIRTTRLDTGVVVSDNVAAVSTADVGNIGGDGYLGLGVFMQFDAHGGAGEAHRLYQGDKFYIDVVGSLSQNFGAQVRLESDENISIEYDALTVDNELGRLLYVGDVADVNAPGTLDTLKIATLGVNVETSVSKLDFSTQESSEDAMRLVDDAIEKVSATRTQNGAVQNRMIREVRSLEELAYQTERYRSQVIDADIAVEVARQTKALISQQSSAQLLQQINRFGLYSLELIQALTR